LQSILNYVLANFFLVYEKTEQINIAFGTENGEAKIFIPDLSADFFENLKPLEVSQIVYKTFENEKLLFLFGTPDCEPFGIENGTIIFNDDIISSAFYFLSGWQEQIAPKDKLNRFTYEVSIQKQLGIAYLPVVNYYFRLLAKSIEVAYGIKLENKIHKEGSFVTCVTHDIDIWSKAWRTDVKSAIRRFDFGTLIKIVGSLISERYLHSSFNIIKDFQSKYGFKSTYFFLPREGEYSGEKNADYDIKRSAYQSIIKSLVADGNEIGLHGGFTASFDANELKTDLANINNPVVSNRFHYLMYDLNISTELIGTQGIKYDSTLGFNSIPGFRNGTSYPFFIYNYQTKESSQVIEIPLMIMDVSIFSLNYLNCQTAEKGFELIEPILSQVKKTGGCLVINWHNNYFSETAFKEWQKLFEMIIKYSKSNQSVFKLSKMVV
jgi:hypothetical protein